MNNKELLISAIGAFIAVFVAGFFSNIILQNFNSPLIIASAGASAILMFGLPHALVSRPWNLIVGHTVSAIIGVSCFYLIANTLLATSVAIPLALVGMHLLKCMHPPGGATAVTAIIGGEMIHHLGYAFVIMPIFFNSLILLIVAIAVGSFRDKNPFEDVS
ncbi:HPP family protein [Bathymodiolus septemdierum thioautotrophic gill symbiont]|uniref:CBS domain membrane protein n=1 Tax=endosymbiont of Bathymodiolus septemdierum str. Myojin knoll TaxID=1303921 RepID=A0A0P0UQ48_9GAMM|nr:HPP family protein [Bathymodiolus septemdierum thioautotrophic gill symbiont]BAS67102.1 CBS domain membrane protein [endosymbiont of Bathymodiolus septemdierum str. Myojin knoll]